MASVDDRVVAMKFDNSVFEQKIAGTISSLDKLKGSLDFANASKGFGALSSAANAVHLGGISSAVSGIEQKFSAMGAVAFSVINNIVNRATTAGLQLAKSLSLGQITSGFKEYETNMNSIQTVLANTSADGTKLEDVNAALDQLNAYSDKTIYNFSQMARNVGTFTAAGVKLDTSVSAIKGIANLAAVSGSNADQASTAMYQLSQAMASGSVKLMDWNSVVNAGMGGAVFQKSLWETGKALGTLKGIPVGQTFEEWSKAGGSFRETLKEGWITTDVLTTTLGGFTGEMTDAQLAAKGYTAEQIKGIQAMGKTATDAATKVKTFTQLIDTVKEAIGSGWSLTFRTIVGDFDQAREMFTMFNSAIGKVVADSSKRRNDLLSGWAALKGRDSLINGVMAGFKALGAVIKMVKDSFHDVFPPMTSQRLFDMTKGFETLMKALMPSKETLKTLHRIFVGLFSALSIGVTVITSIFKVFKQLFTQFASANGSSILNWFANLGDKISELKKRIVDGQGILAFFESLKSIVEKFISGLTFDNVLDRLKAAVTSLKDNLMYLFTGKSVNTAEEFSKMLGRLKERFSPLVKLVHALGTAWDWFTSKLSGIKTALGRFGDFVKRQFANIPQAIADIFAKTDYSQALDTVNTGLFAGFVLLIKKFFDKGFGFNGKNGLIASITGSFDALTGTLQSMQTKVKAEALFKIAGALALLTASIVVLAMIDSAAMTRAMVAISTGFGILVTALRTLDKAIAGPKSAAKLSALAAALILLAGAMLILSLAAKIFSTMGWEELAKGLGAITVLLGVLTVAVKALSGDTAGMIRAGVGLIAIAIALNILAGAVKIFATMSWTEMGKGLAGVAGGLALVVAAVNLMPKGMVAKGVGLIAIAVALNILALAVKSFAEMKWSEMGKGMAGVAGALLIIAGAMRLMPNGVLLALQGVGLALIGVGLVAIAKAMVILSTLSWEEMGKGLAGIAGTLLLLALAANAMSGSILGAIAIGIIALSLGKLAEGLKQFAGLKWGDLLKGLVAIAAVLAVFGVAAYLLIPVIPALLGLGLALALVGGGFALFGLGANMVATAFAILATAGTQGVATLMSALDGIIERLPALIQAFGEGILGLAQELVKALPVIVAGLGKILGSLIQLVIDNIPLLATAFTTFITEALKSLETIFPQLVTTGFKLLTELLRGISDNIETITATVAEIIVKFLVALSKKLPDLVTAGMNALVEFLKGVTKNLEKVVGAVGDLLAKLVLELGKMAGKLATAGGEALVAFLGGITKEIKPIADAVVTLITTFATQIVNKENVKSIANAFFDMIIGAIDGLTASINANSGRFGESVGRLVGALVKGIGGALRGALRGMANELVPGLGDTLFGGGDYSTTDSSGRPNYSKSNSLTPKSTPKTKSVGTEFATTMSRATTMATSEFESSPPTITPVVDMSNVYRSASQIGNILSPSKVFTSGVSYDQAASIASTTSVTSDIPTEPAPVTTKEVTFVQNNYSPEALSTADIYRQSRNQIDLAKKELAVV